MQRGSRLAQKVKKLIEKEARRNNHQMLPIYEENGIFNFYLEEHKVEPMEIATVDNKDGKGMVASQRVAPRDPMSEPSSNSSEPSFHRQPNRV